MEVQIAGKLFWQDMVYDLVDPHPSLDKEHWMTDQDEIFKVVHLGNIFDVIVSRPFLVSRMSMGQRVPVKAIHLKEVVDKI